MKDDTIEVLGIEIRLEAYDREDYISLTDIAKNNSDQKPKTVLTSWLRNQSTISFLGAWERTFNPDFKGSHLAAFREMAVDNRTTLSLTKFIEMTGAIGIISKPGRYGGTFAHKDIALNFCYWLSPEFQVAMIKAFQVLMEREMQRKNLEWHISKITDNIDEVRQLLDSIPGQREERKRLPPKE